MTHESSRLGCWTAQTANLIYSLHWTNSRNAICDNLKVLWNLFCRPQQCKIWIGVSYIYTLTSPSLERYSPIFQSRAFYFRNTFPESYCSVTYSWLTSYYKNRIIISNSKEKLIKHYKHISPLRGPIKRSSWDAIESGVVVPRILCLLGSPVVWIWY
jgi:hypothetical protein